MTFREITPERMNKAIAVVKAQPSNEKAKNALRQMNEAVLLAIEKNKAPGDELLEPFVESLLLVKVSAPQTNKLHEIGKKLAASSGLSKDHKSLGHLFQACYWHNGPCINFAISEFIKVNSKRLLPFAEKEVALYLAKAEVMLELGKMTIGMGEKANEQNKEISRYLISVGKPLSSEKWEGDVYPEIANKGNYLAGFGCHMVGQISGAVTCFGAVRGGEYAEPAKTLFTQYGDLAKSYVAEVQKSGKLLPVEAEFLRQIGVGLTDVNAKNDELCAIGSMFQSYAWLSVGKIEEAGSAYWEINRHGWLVQSVTASEDYQKLQAMLLISQKLGQSPAAAIRGLSETKPPEGQPPSPLTA